MKRIFTVSLFLLLAHQQIIAQSKSFTLPLAAKISVGEIKEDWQPSLQENEEVMDEHHQTGLLDSLKNDLMKRIHISQNNNSSSNLRDELDTPYVWKALQGNTFGNSVPNDNDIAVSTTGFLVSVMNTSVFKYDLNKDSSLGQVSLDAFCSVLNNNHSKFDPKVIYDPDENRFIVVFLAGLSDSVSNIIVAFSQTDDPNGVWNCYELPGNPLNDSLYTDFPMLSLSNHEFFITVNHLVNAGSWQTAWRRTVIWQINKFSGYDGDSLHTQLHYDINYNNRGVRNLCPVKGGSHLYGSEMYFLSERNLDEVNDTFFLVHITDTINSSSQMLTVSALVSPASYFVPVNGKQSAGGDLATNDSRVLGAFYENDKIQFVGNTTDTLFGTSAFYYGVVSDVATNPSVSITIVSDDTICYGYPNISYAGSGPNDNTAIIDVLRSAVNLYAGYSAMVTDADGNYSVLKNIKKGNNYFSMLSGTERWGDYSGTQPDYNSPGTVWVNGSYGTSSKTTSTWIAKVSLLPPPASVQNVEENTDGLLLYPNPSEDQVLIKFTVEKLTNCSFDLFDASGKLIKNLMAERVMPGENQFAFSTAPLSAGQYVLVIASDGKKIFTRKILKQ